MNRPPHEWFAELASAGAVIGAFNSVIPSIAALVGLLWYVIMIGESKTFQRIFIRNRNKEDQT